MNFSELKTQVYGYLGFRGVTESPETDEMIRAVLSSLESTVQFNYLYKSFETVPEFLQKPPYEELLRGCRGVILSVMTLGAGVDRRINQLSRTDMPRAIVYDACASAYLEARSDEYEKTLGDDLTYRFCPGYGGSDVSDIKHIFELLRPEKIGVTLNENFFMLPSKSMAGIIGIGKKAEKTCEGCFMLPHCRYREDGKRCYSLEKR